MPGDDTTTTIQVRRTTAERLQALKVPGLTYDDVITLALDHLPPKEIESLYKEWQREALRALKSDARVTKRKPS